MRAAILLLFLALLGSTARSGRPTAKLELVYLANEGFLLRAGESELLIDAFVAEPYGGYAALTPELRTAMMAGTAPFDGIELALASHRHRDHFQAEAAAEFLRAHPETSFVSSPQVAADLRRALGDDAAAARSAELLPEAGKSATSRSKTVAIELVRLPHSGGERTADVQNLGHVLELGGVHVLHVGDAEELDPAVDGYDLETRAIDVALVPYWWLGDAAGLARAKKLTGAKHLVAVHVPPAELTTVKAHLAALDPEVLLFERPGESRELAFER